MSDEQKNRDQLILELDELRRKLSAAESRIADRDAAAVRQELLNEELRKSLDESERRLNSFFKGSTAGLALLDRKLRYTKMNDLLADMNGLPAAEHIGKSVQEVLPGLAPVVEPILRKVLSTGKPILNIEITGETPSQPGIQRHWLESIFPTPGVDGTPEGVGAIVVEITERKKMEETLRVSEERATERAHYLQAILDATPAIILTAHDRECRTITGNRAAREVCHVDEDTNLSKGGHEPKQVARHHLFVDGKELAPDEMPLQIAARSGRKLRDYSMELVLDDGTRHSLLGNISPVFDSEGNPQGAIAAFTDITELKRIENALRKSESRLNLAIHQAGMGTWDTDLVSGQTFWSQNHFQLLGYEPDSDGLATFEMWQSRVHPDDFDRVMREYELAKRDHGLYSPEHRIIRADTGEVVWLTVFGRFLYDDDGKAIRFSGIFFDSTECKRADEALHESELRLKTILQTTNEGFWLIDNDTVTIDINPRMCAILGRNREEVLGRKIFDFVDDENRAVFEQQIKTRGQGQLGTYEIALTRPDGSQVFCLNNATPLVDGSGKKVGSFGMWKDITERKQAEKNIQESERKYRELVELANSIILRWTHDGRITFLNEFGQRFFGYSSEEIIGRRVVDTIVPKTETGGREIQQLMERICADPGSFEQSINENVRRNGERAWIAWTNKIVWNRQRQVSEILSVGTDVTERKLSEAALRESEERFSLAMEATKD